MRVKVRQNNWLISGILAAAVANPDEFTDSPPSERWSHGCATARDAPRPAIRVAPPMRMRRPGRPLPREAGSLVETLAHTIYVAHGEGVIRRNPKSSDFLSQANRGWGATEPRVTSWSGPAETRCGRISTPDLILYRRRSGRSG